MEISNALQANIYSLRQAIGVANLRTAMNQDAQSMDALLADMKDTTAKTMEASVTPHKGKAIDIQV